MNNKLAIRTQILAGLTSFFAISYIIVVNPIILSDSNIPVNLSVFATILSSSIGCFIVAFWSKSPIIVTPGMGVNAFFTYTLVVGMKLSWQQAIAISIFSGIIYFIIAITKYSEKLSNSIPSNLKHGITSGIGLFLVVIGLEKAKLIVSGSHHVLLAPGNLLTSDALLAIFGLLITLVLFIRNIPGSFLIGIAITSLLGAILQIHDPNQISISFQEIKNYHNILIKGDFSQILTIKFLLSVFSMTMILVFESMGLIEGILPDKSKFQKTFEACSLATLLSGFLGTSPTVPAAESASGIEVGGHNGIVPLTSGFLFLISIFFIPLLTFVPQSAIAPVIIITGALMMKNLSKINYDDFTEWFPCFFIVVLIPLTGSISRGLSFGFVSYIFIKIIAGKYKKISKTLYLLGLLFLIEIISESFLI